MTHRHDDGPLTPVTLEIVEGVLESTMKEIEAQVERTARSTNIREANDHVPAIFDAAGRSVASVSFTANVDPILKRWQPDEIHPGDVFLWNHPYESDGGIGHLPDLCLTLPVFFDGRIVAWVQELGHVQDIGGMVPGSLSQTATEIFQEGLIVPPLKLYERGVRNGAVHRLLLANTRFPDDMEGDVDAMISGARLGVARLEWLCEQHGAAKVERAFDALIERCRRTLLEAIFPQIPDGSYEYEDYVEYVDVSPEESRQFIRIFLRMTKSPQRLLFDFTGTDEQVRGSINFPADARFYARALLTTFKAIQPDLLVNDGVLEVVEVRVPEGTVLNPRFPAACSYRHYPLIRCFSVVLGALARALGGRVPQGADNMSGISFSGIRPETGQTWYLSMPLGGGSCGRPVADGTDTVLMTPGRNVPSEYGETFYPLRIREFGLNPDSGGAGRHRGGLGYRILIEFLAPARVRVRTDRYYLEPTGVDGGRPGGTAQFVINPGMSDERALPGKSDNGAVKAGDTLLVTSPGGGGWGDPLERDADLVALDVERGLVTVDAARQHYGVVIGDPAATGALRHDIAARRGARPLFDRGERYRDFVRRGVIEPRTTDP
jgi:N-methylhydantoinase B